MSEVLMCPFIQDKVCTKQCTFKTAFELSRSYIEALNTRDGSHKIIEAKDFSEIITSNSKLDEMARNTCPLLKENANIDNGE